MIEIKVEIPKIEVHIHNHGCVAAHADIINRLEKIMSAISDFVAKQKEFNDATGKSIDDIGVSLTGITGDIKGLNDKITQLQNNPGPISPEDQALLDGLQADGAALAAKAKAASDALAALDAMTPPVAPPAA